jgi:hypothetical protein
VIVPLALDLQRTMTFKEQARLSREACNVLTARLDCQKATCEAMEHELLQRHSHRETLEGAAGGNATTPKRAVTLGRDIVDVSSCVSLRTVDEGDDEEEEKLVMTANTVFESDTDDEENDEVYNLRREHQQAARKSLVRHAIKGDYSHFTRFNGCILLISITCIHRPCLMR